MPPKADADVLLVCPVPPNTGWKEGGFVLLPCPNVEPEAAAPKPPDAEVLDTPLNTGGATLWPPKPDPIVPAPPKEGAVGALMPPNTEGVVVGPPNDDDDIVPAVPPNPPNTGALVVWVPLPNTDVAEVVMALNNPEPGAGFWFPPNIMEGFCKVCYLT